MAKWTRRGILKAGIAASAGAASPLGDFSWAADPFDAAGESAVGQERDPLWAEERNVSCRERICLDPEWRFHFGHAADPAKDLGYGAAAREQTFAKSGDFPEVCQLEFNDHDWRAVDLPHDWAVELPVINAPDLPDHGGRPLGRNYPETSIGWYRRVFELTEADRGKRVSVDFDGIFRDAIVIFNGFYLGRHFSGYTPVSFDLTDIANFGSRNVLVVRADATLGEGWYYEGAGIYRHVWLVKTAPLHLVADGTFVRSDLHSGRASLVIASEIHNQSETEAHCKLMWEVLDPGGRPVASATTTPVTVGAGEKAALKGRITVEHPRLWSIEEPNLYRLVTSTITKGGIVDQTETTFGIRSIRFDAHRGFFLNGKPVKIKGTCNHQDHAGVGTALPDRLQAYRVERLKEMGSNAYRAAHNPPAPELLDACDRLGMLVLDETRMMSSSPEGLSQMERMIRRDRNHPSVILWSLGNEEWTVQGDDRGRRIVESMRRPAHQLDPSRPVTVAMDSGYSSGQGVPKAVDVQGFNYQREDLDAFHRTFPALPTIGTETAGTYSTRGAYDNDRARGYVSAYDVNCPDYGATAEKWWSFFAERDFLAGGLVWTGFDYRGEPSPYGWPCVSSHFGALDACGFPKDNYFYYQAWWGAKPVLHLLPHWNWEGREGTVIPVWCHTNLDGVELFLNGKSLGAQRVRKNSHLAWDVEYVPGVLEAHGFRDGRVVLNTRRETTGTPAAVVATADRNQLAADGKDVSVVSVQIVDAPGRVVPTAENQVQFELTGPGRLIGVGNGNPSCHEPDKPASPTTGTRRAFNGLCMAFVQSLPNAGSIQLSATSAGLRMSTITIRTV
jgi:beta-galactosidase